MSRILLGLFSLAFILHGCGKSGEDNQSLTNETMVRQGLDFYRICDTPYATDGPHGQYVTSHEWQRLELSGVVVPDSMHCINIWVQAYSPAANRSVSFKDVQVTRNGDTVNRSEFACSDTANWKGEWFYDGDPYNVGDDDPNHNFGYSNLSVDSTESEHAIRITVPGDRFSAAAFIDLNQIQVAAHDTLGFAVRVKVD